MVIVILLAVLLFIALNFIIWLYLSYREEKEYAKFLHEKLKEIPVLKTKLEASVKKEKNLLRDLETEKQLRAVLQKQYVKLAKEKKSASDKS